MKQNLEQAVKSNSWYVATWWVAGQIYMDYITIAQTGNAVDFGDLTVLVRKLLVLDLFFNKRSICNGMEEC